MTAWPFGKKRNAGKTNSDSFKDCRVMDVKLTSERPVKIHIDNAELKAQNWLSVTGWIKGLKKGEACATSNLGHIHFILTDRPDVCHQFKIDSNLAYGFTLHFLSTEPCSGLITINLTMDCLPLADIMISSNPGNKPSIPFATRAAKKLTQRLYLNPATGRTIIEDKDVTILSDGTITPSGMELTFDNTRIGNYHSEVMDLLSDSRMTGLDIGCGIRDMVFDNLVTQDIYPTPTATIITQPAENKLPFRDACFDLVILDSVLEHVPWPLDFLKEAARVLKRGGKIIGDVPFLQPLHLAPYHFFNFTPHGLKEVAKRAGLKLRYVGAQAHQRPEFSLEWFLRRTFDTIPSSEADRLRNMKVGDFLDELTINKDMFTYPTDVLTELSAGFHFKMQR